MTASRYLLIVIFLIVGGVSERRIFRTFKRGSSNRQGTLSWTLEIIDRGLAAHGKHPKRAGGSTDRPNLQRLLDDIRARKIDVIVVYKVDRLTRSLADFAKLVELFDAHGVSFVSVTQQFNTTTSMGRLTLNVLLSFAQFEREVTSERIRDKIAASKRKGLWVGGPLPLGYEMKDEKVVVVEEEAKRVRLIYRRYLELSGVNELVRDLKQRNIRTKARLLVNGATRGGIPFQRGTLFYLLAGLRRDVACSCFCIGADSARSRPPFRNDLAHRSDLISPAIPR